MNPRDVLAMIETILTDARSKVTPLFSMSVEEAKRQHDEAGPVTRIASGFAAGMLAAKVVNNLAR
jgi:hypothetical protein